MWNAQLWVIKVNYFCILTDFMGIERLLLCIIVKKKLTLRRVVINNIPL